METQTAEPKQERLTIDQVNERLKGGWQAFSIMITNGGDPAACSAAFRDFEVNLKAKLQSPTTPLSSEAPAFAVTATPAATESKVVSAPPPVPTVASSSIESPLAANTTGPQAELAAAIAATTTAPTSTLEPVMPAPPGEVVPATAAPVIDAPAASIDATAPIAPPPGPQSLN